MTPVVGDEAYWKSQRLRVLVDEDLCPKNLPGDFRVMEIFPEARMWIAKKKDLVKLELDKMARVKLSPGDMLTYRRFNSEVQSERQRTMEALHAYTWNPDPETAKVFWVEMQARARRMRDICQEQEVFMKTLEKKHDFSRRDSIVLDLYTDEIGIHRDS